jgi:transcriptional regulator with XRE-family HTH domain
MLSKVKNTRPAESEELRVAAGAWFKALREDRGLSQRDLSNRLNLEYYTFISQLENGRGRIPAGRYREWAKALEIDERVFVKAVLSFYEPETFKVLFGDEALAAPSIVRAEA